MFSLQSMAAYGFEMIETLIVQIVPDDCVKKAMNENAGNIYGSCAKLVPLCCIS